MFGNGKFKINKTSICGFFPTRKQFQNKDQNLSTKFNQKLKIHKIVKAETKINASMLKQNSFAWNCQI